MSGLVTEIVPHDRLVDRALELASQIAEVPGPTMAGLKAIYSTGAAAVIDPALSAEIRNLVETVHKAHVADLHLWHLGPGHRGLILSLVSADAATAEEIKQTLRARHPDLSQTNQDSQKPGIACV